VFGLKNMNVEGLNFEESHSFENVMIKKKDFRECNHINV
jgi:hypothetical protein